jgi:hypothetical protein
VLHIIGLPGVAVTLPVVLNFKAIIVFHGQSCNNRSTIQKDRNIKFPIKKKDDFLNKDF